MFSEWIRRRTFWLQDFLRGSKVRKHYNDIKKIIENNEESVHILSFLKLKPFQLIQQNRTEFCLKLNGAKEVYRDSEFINMLKSIYGEEADITIEHVSEVPVLESGKRKSVVCEYQPVQLAEEII